MFPGSIIAYGRVVVNRVGARGRSIFPMPRSGDGIRPGGWRYQGAGDVINEGGIVLAHKSRLTRSSSPADGPQATVFSRRRDIVCCFLFFLLRCGISPPCLSFRDTRKAFEQAMFALQAQIVHARASFVILSGCRSSAGDHDFGIILIPFVPFRLCRGHDGRPCINGRRLGRMAMKRITGDSHSGIFEAFVGISL